jgi:hypothetical protein
MLYDATGLLSGKTGDQYTANPLYGVISIFTNLNSDLYRKNADGKEILTPQDKGPASQYLQYCFKTRLSPQDAIKEMNSPYTRIHYGEAWIKQTIKKLVSGVLASPVSRAPVCPARGNVRAG